MADPTIQQIINGMPSRFDPQAAGDVDMVLQFRLSGDQGCNFYANIADGKCDLETGQHPSPTLTLSMSAATYVDMVMGRLTGQQAFFTRKLRYEGPIALAIRIHRFFQPPEKQAVAS